MTLAHKLVGSAMQMAVCQIADGQTVYCEAGKFLWKTPNVTVETRLTKPQGNQQSAPASAGGLLSKAMDISKRVLAGESLAFQYYKANGSGLVTFAGVLPGEMRAIELDGTKTWLAEKDAFVAAESTVDFGIAFAGWKTGRKGGEGFVLEKFSGTGTLLIAGAGNFIDLNPAKYGGKIQVDTGCVVAFEDTIKYGVERVGALNTQTAMTAMFGGEGLSLATLEGDGQVILQSMTMDGLAKALLKNAGIGDDKQGLLGGLLSGSVEQRERSPRKRGEDHIHPHRTGLRAWGSWTRSRRRPSRHSPRARKPPKKAWPRARKQPSSVRPSSRRSGPSEATRPLARPAASTASRRAETSPSTTSDPNAHGPAGRRARIGSGGRDAGVRRGTLTDPLEAWCAELG
jgi:uncharacterized protein (AIM24 family)